jgi:MFS family permease
LPLYGLRTGLTEGVATTALGVLILGNVLLQPLVGWAADRWSWRLAMGACAGLVGVGGLALPFLIGSAAWRWPLLFAWGAAGFGVYTVALAQLGHRFTGAALVSGTTAFTMTWGIGGILGSPLAGSAMEAFGPHGLPLLLGAAFLPLVALSLVTPSAERPGVAVTTAASAAPRAGPCR